MIEKGNQVAQGEVEFFNEDVVLKAPFKSTRSNKITVESLKHVGYVMLK